jgi:AcrR family transcriptional regulator
MRGPHVKSTGEYMHCMVGTSACQRMMTCMTGLTGSARRQRDAAATRRALLDAAVRRFTTEGYAKTTTRQIADDAGVNVALIGRYFTSKEGLFEACLAEAVDEVSRTVGDVTRSAGPAEAISAMAVGASRDARPGLRLLLRSSGDPAAEDLRLGVLKGCALRWAKTEDGADDEDRLLPAQILLATAIGITLLRSSSPLEPLSQAGADELAAPLRRLVDALLGPGSDYRATAHAVNASRTSSAPA